MGYYTGDATTDALREYLAASYVEEGGFGPEERAELRRLFPEVADVTLEIEVRPGGGRVKVDTWIFRSWTGPRFADGEPYDGPVYVLGSREEA